MKKWDFYPKTLIKSGLGGQMPVLLPTTSIFFFRWNAKLNNESDEQEENRRHSWKNGHLTLEMVKKQ